MNKLIYSIPFLLLCSLLCYSQTTPQPTPPVGGSNSVVFSDATNSYIFSYNGPDGNLSYNYSLDSGGGSLQAITTTVNNSFTFWPSTWGGIILDVNGNTYYPWEHGYSLISAELIDNTLYVDWLAVPPFPIVIVQYYYRYIIHIEGRTLIIKVEQVSNNNIVAEFHPTRSYSDPNIYGNIHHYFIGVPYLKLFNVLYTGSNSDDNNGVFSSLFFDWTATNASELYPLNGTYSNTSVYYSQSAQYKKKTDDTRNPLNETIYLTVSPKLDDVFPNIPNPVSAYRAESKNRVIFDYWQSFNDIWNTTTTWELRQLIPLGTNHGWLIIHPWQKNGYDCGYPTDVMPANQNWGGNDALINIRNIAVNELGYLFSLHEDYWFIQEGVPNYDPTLLSLPIQNWHWCNGDPSITQHSIKPTYYNYYYQMVSPIIHNTYGTNSTYDDAYTNAPPSWYVDYDANEPGAGKFLFALEKLRQAGPDLQKIHLGPVSAEGGSHYLFAGYFDDFEAEIYTGENYSPGFRLGGYYRPLLVNFDLLKIRQKCFVHGMGYYDRFFCGGSNYYECWGSGIQGMGPDSVLIYTASELAYAHGGFFGARYNNEDLLYQAGIQFNHVYPMQSLYGDAPVVSILYNDNGLLLTASDYIKKYPDRFNCFTTNDGCDNSNFMGQVRIEYGNGVRVYVNRHPWKHWVVNDIPQYNGWYNYHVNDGGEPVINNTGLEYYDLPPENGWVCYSLFNPNNDNTLNKVMNISPFKFNLNQNYPNPFNPKTEINYEIAKDLNVTIKIYNIIGELVIVLVNNEFKKAGNYTVEFDGTNLASGVYFYKIQAGDFNSAKKMVLIK